MRKRLALIALCILSIIAFIQTDSAGQQKPSSQPLEGYPPIPYLGQLYGAVEVDKEEGKHVVVELFHPSSNKWYAKVPRGLIGEAMAKDNFYAWSYVPLLILKVKFESNLRLYTRDVEYDYYLIEQQ